MPVNNFYVQPAQANLAPVVQGIGNLVKESRAEDAKKADTEKLMTAFKNGSPDAVAELIAQKPELSAQLDKMIGFKSDVTKSNYKDSVTSLLSTADVEERKQILADRINTITENEGNPTETIRSLAQLDKDPEGFQESLNMAAAGVLNKQEYAELKSRQPKPVDPFKQAELDIKRDTLNMRKLESRDRRSQIGVNKEANQLKREQLQLDIDAKKEALETKKINTRKEMRQKIVQKGDLFKSIEDFTKNKDYMNSVSGKRGLLPSLTTTGIEADAFLGNIKDNLTMTNLDKMVGVLSETDIKILASAGSALRAGMSKKTMMKEFKRIQEVSERQKEEVKAQLSKLAGGEAPDSASTGESNQNTAAAEWARANPNDPRAAKILQKIGG